MTVKNSSKKLLTRSYLSKLKIPSVFFAGMILASTLGWNWQPALKQIEQSGYTQSPILFPINATVTKVLDGDTFEIDNGQSVRMVGINAPDRGEKNYDEAKNYLADIIEGEQVRLEYDAYQEDQFGRLLAYVWEKCTTTLGCANGERMVNWVLLKNKMATFVSYKDRRTLKYDSLLSSAQSN